MARYEALWDDQNPTRVKANLSATRDPVVSDDGSQGWEVGSRWHNTVSRTAFVCVYAGTGRAAWVIFATEVLSGEVKGNIDNVKVRTLHAKGHHLQRSAGSRLHMYDTAR